MSKASKRPFCSLPPCKGELIARLLNATPSWRAHTRESAAERADPSRKGGDERSNYNPP
jgi:hypothetical protein